MNDMLCISWDSYLNNVSKGFSYLQQNAEFVDMTLAADGHLVKVHQNIIALASPYLKAMLQSASCPHPVIFLNNVSNEILGYILQYIYTGEVKIPINIIDVFVNACKSLCIKGIDTINPQKNIPTTEVKSDNKRIGKPLDKNVAAHITINTQDNNYNLEVIHNQNNNITTDNERTIPCANLQVNSNKDIINDTKEMLPYTDIKVLSNENNSLNNDHIEVTPLVDHSTISDNDPNIESSQIVDISSINSFVVLEPKTHTNEEVNTNKAGNQINVLSDIVIKEPNMSSNVSSQSSVLERPINININTDCQDFIQNSSKIKLLNNPVISTLQTDNNISQEEIMQRPEINLNNIVFDKDYWQQQSNEVTRNLFNITPLIVNTLEPGQSNSHIELVKTLQDYESEYIEAEDKKEPVVLKAKRQDIKKNLKKIAALTKLKNKTENTSSSNKVNKLQIDQVLHFTISTRGTLQLILHPFMYNNHHQSHGGLKRRWRCIDYRKLRCPAFVDTENDAIKSMLTDHLHPAHENIIKKKIKTNLLFTSLTGAITSINTIIKEQHS